MHNRTSRSPSAPASKPKPESKSLHPTLSSPQTPTLNNGHERFSNYCVSLAQILYRYEIRLRTGLWARLPPSHRATYARSPSRVRLKMARIPCRGVSLCRRCLISESWRSSRSEARRHAGDGNVLDELQLRVGVSSARRTRRLRSARGRLSVPSISPPVVI